MKIVDLNVLLYAINRDSTHHRQVKQWWEAALEGDEPVGLAWVVILGFLRLSTHPKLFAQPLSVDTCLALLDDWLTHPAVRVVRETEEQWQVLRELLSQSGTAGNLTTDAHLASLAITNGAKLISCDTDFGRFRHLRWENPLDE